MKIAVGCDHGGYLLKNKLIDYLKQKGHNILDVGCFCPEDCDYPEFGYKAARLVSKKVADRAILICKTGIGYSIVANKVRGVRAALCNTVGLASSSRAHNDANILVLAALYTNLDQARRITSVWLKTKAEAGRHARRVRQIARIEKRHG